MDILGTVKSVCTAYGGFSIGKSECGNDLWCVHRGSTYGKQLIITAAIHARECYTALAVIEQIRAFDGSLGGAYFIPLVNPDGAAFFESGTDFGKALLKANKTLRNAWKANADGVDLNCNFDANFGTGALNKRTAGASEFIGECPLCAAESRALWDFTESVRPDMTVSYHCMGGELYWEFFQSGAERARDESIARRIADYIGVTKVDGDLNSAGGYKDCCVQKLRIPAVTIELIKRGAHPFPPSAYAEDVSKNRLLPQYVLSII